MLAFHRDLGCLCGAILAERRYSPVIFSRTQKRGLPVARLVFAENHRLVADAGALIARFLLRSGVLFLTLHAGRNERMPTGFSRNRSNPVQVKGEWNAERFDQAFSELAFLRL